VPKYPARKWAGTLQNAKNPIDALVVIVRATSFLGRKMSRCGCLVKPVARDVPLTRGCDGDAAFAAKLARVGVLLDFTTQDIRYVRVS
jgi:hypothetical protein